MELNAADRYILELLNRDLGGQCAIAHYEKEKVIGTYSFHTSSDAIRVYSKVLCQGLMKNGICPQKTVAAEYPTPTAYVRDFVRGYLDGDGCIYISPKNHCIVSFTCANGEFLRELDRVICKEIGFNGSIYTENDRKYRLMYYRAQDVKSLLDWIYLGCGCYKLLRKYEKYQSFYGLAA